MKELFAVIGNPIEHSLSPLLQNEAYQLNNIDAHFQAFQVEREELERAVYGMKALGVKGFIVTVPFKSAILPFLDAIDPSAKQMNAVNIVRKIEGKYVGYNYDGEAFLQALLEDMGKVSLSTEKVLLIGAGGAAQSIYCALAEFEHVHVDVANRTKENAEKLIALRNMPCSRVITFQEAESLQAEYDIIIQTTSIGMWPNIAKSPIQLTNLKEGTFVSDIIYNPSETQLMKQARNCGARTQNGMKMLALQNALAIEKWTGKKVSYNKMMSTLKRTLTE